MRYDIYRVRFVNAQFVDDSRQDSYRKDNRCEGRNKLQCASDSETFAVGHGMLASAYTHRRAGLVPTHIYRGPSVFG